MNILTIERFDAYLNNTLSVEEKALFEKQLDADKAFSDAFKLHKAACEAVIRAGKARELTQRLKKELQEDGFFESLKEGSPPLPTSNIERNRWKFFRLHWAALLLIIISALLLFNQYLLYRKINSLQRQIIALDTLRRISVLEDDLLRHDSDITNIKLILEKHNSKINSWDTLDAILKEKGLLKNKLIDNCKLTIQERALWYNEFLYKERQAMVSAGTNNKSQNKWMEEFKDKNKNNSEALRLLREKAKLSPGDMTILEYYILGSLLMFEERNPSEAVWFLEKAIGVDRSAHTKLLLAAYLDNDEPEKAKLWIKEQKIPIHEWPKGSIKCLR